MGKAWFCTELNAPLILRDTPPIEAPSADNLIVDVLTAGADFVATLLVQGKYQAKPPLPFTPGAEVSGIVSAIGETVEGFRVGDLVQVQNPVGGFAEQILVPEIMCYKLRWER